jgi:hypothetical protein
VDVGCETDAREMEDVPMVDYGPDPGLQPRRGGMLVARGDNPGYGALPPPCMGFGWFQ